MVTEWISMLLEKNKASSEKDLTPEMIAEEIRDTQTSISNEKLWALGSPTKMVAKMHNNNIEVMREYILYLELLL